MYNISSNSTENDICSNVTTRKLLLELNNVKKECTSLASDKKKLQLALANNNTIITTLINDVYKTKQLLSNIKNNDINKNDLKNNNNDDDDDSNDNNNNKDDDDDIINEKSKKSIIQEIVSQSSNNFKQLIDAKLDHHIKIDYDNDDYIKSLKKQNESLMHSVFTLTQENDRLRSLLSSNDKDNIDNINNTNTNTNTNSPQPKLKALVNSVIQSNKKQSNNTSSNSNSKSSSDDNDNHYNSNDRYTNATSKTSSTRLSKTGTPLSAITKVKNALYNYNKNKNDIGTGTGIKTSTMSKMTNNNNNNNNNFFFACNNDNDTINTNINISVLDKNKHDYWDKIFSELSDDERYSIWSSIYEFVSKFIVNFPQLPKFYDKDLINKIIEEVSLQIRPQITKLYISSSRSKNLDSLLNSHFIINEIVTLVTLYITYINSK